MSQTKTPKIHPAHAEFASLDESKFVRVYNKSEGALLHEVRLKDDPPRMFKIAGSSFERVPKEVADLWLRDFPGRIVTDDDAKKLIEGANAEADKLRDELAKAHSALAQARAKSDSKGELAKAQAEADKLRKEADDLRKQNAELLEKATAPTPPAADTGI